MAATGVGLLALLAAAPAAQAAEVRVGTSYYGGEDRPGFFQYFAEAGETNTPTINFEDGAIVVTDTVTLESGDDSCDISADGRTATCEDPDGFESMDVFLADGDDTAVNNVPAMSENPTFSIFRMYGDAGDDDLTGSDGANDSLLGGPGADTLSGRGGDDNLQDSFAFGYPTPPQGSDAAPNVMSGGEGGDLVAGGPGPDDLNGDAGNDQLADSGGGATMLGGDGDDVVRREAYVDAPVTGDVVADGGPGGDMVTFFLYQRSFDDGPGINEDTPGAFVRLDAANPTTGNGLPGYNDTLSNIEDVGGSQGKDDIGGSAVANNLYGNSGKDTIDGGAGRDNLEGAGSADTIRAQDGEGDRVRCANVTGGDPGDTAAVDAADIVDRCPAEGGGTTVTQPPPLVQPQPQPGPVREVRVPVQVPGPQAPPPDTTRPDITGTKLGKTVKLSTLRKPGYRVQVASTDAQANQVVATLTGRLRGRVRVSAIGDLIIAQRTRSFTGRTSFRLKPTRKLARSIRRGSRLRLVVEVRDAAGNRSTRSVRIRVR